MRPWAPLATNAAAAAEEALDSVVLSLYFPRVFRLSIFCQSSDRRPNAVDLEQFRHKFHIKFGVRSPWAVTQSCLTPRSFQTFLPRSRFTHHVRLLQCRYRGGIGIRGAHSWRYTTRCAYGAVMNCTSIIADERESLLDDGVYGVGSTMTERQSGPLLGKSKSVDASTGSCPPTRGRQSSMTPVVLLSTLKVPTLTKLHGKLATSIRRNPASNKLL